MVNFNQYWQPMKIRVIADDFTSASDGIASFASRSWPCAVAFSPTEPQTAAVVSCDTDSRVLPETQAAECAASWAAAWQDAQVLIKQFDSTLRGPVAAEIAAAWASSGRAKLVVAPAFPDTGRTTQAGVVYVHGQPVSQTAVAADPLNPVKESDLGVLLHAAGISAKVCLPHQIIETLRSVDAVIVDAHTEADLDTIASTHASIPNALWSGSTGLVRAFARVLASTTSSENSPSIVIPIASKTWVCIGSRNPVSIEQKAFLSAANLSGVTLIATDELPGDPHEQASQLASAVALAVKSGRCDSLIATGGETAKHIAQALQAKRLYVLRELAPGIPLCALELADQTLPFITKAGGFGTQHSLLELTQALQRQHI
jgi:D-threonate/D-erythronate kinase